MRQDFYEHLQRELRDYSRARPASHPFVDAWLRYLALRDKGLKPQWKKALEEAFQALDSLPLEDRDDLTGHYLDFFISTPEDRHRAVNGGLETKYFPYPFHMKVLKPFLERCPPRDLERRRPYFGPGGGMAEYLKQNPDDTETRDRLVWSLARSYENNLIEVPDIILTDPVTFKKHLELFIWLTSGRPEYDKWKDDIAEWRRYSQCWTDYHNQEKKTMSFRDYLESLGWQERQRPKGFCL